MRNKQQKRSQSKRSLYLGGVLALAVSGVAAQLTHADTNWLGGTSTDWNDPSNWSNGVPVDSSGSVQGTALINGGANSAVFSTGTAVADWNIAIGSLTAGTLTQSGGSLSAGPGNWLLMGQNGGNGTFNLDAGTFSASEVRLVRTSTTGTALVNIAGGTLTSSGVFAVNDSQNGTASGVGTVNVSNGGVLNSNGDLLVSFAGGNAASGTVNINAGGTVNVGAPGERWVIINQYDGAHGYINVNGGALNLLNNTDIRFATGNNNSSTGASAVTLASGSIVGTAGSLIDLNYASNNAGVNTTFNLNGGTLTIGQIITNNNSGTATFNFNGGTLTAAGTQASFLTLGGTNQSARVQAGGAIINTNGFDVTITEALKAGTGSGGLTKLGAGVLTLTAANTFVGAVNVNAGTLYANKGNAANNQVFSTVSSITVGNGATLRTSSNGLFGWDGTQEKPIYVDAGGTLVANGGLGSDVGVGTVTLAGGTLATLTTGATDWGSWRFDAATDKLVVTADSIASAANVRFQNGAPVDVAAGATLTFTGTITDTTNGGISTVVKNGDGTLLLVGNSAYSGATTISAGTLQVGNGNAATLNNGNYGGAVTNAGTLAFNSSATQSLTGGISGGGILTKDGSGTLSIGGTSTLGAVSVSGGRLNVNGPTSAGNTSVADGAILGTKVTNAAAGVLSLGSNGLTMGNSGFAIDFNNLNPTAPIVDLSGGQLTLDGLVTTSIAGVSALSTGQYVLIDYGTRAGAGSFDESDMALGARSSGAVSDNGSAIVLTVSADKPVWTGVNGSAWKEYAVNSSITDGNFALKSSNTATDFWTNDDVEFNDTYNLGAGPVAVTNSTATIDAAGVTASTVTFNNSAVTYTIDGAGGINGAGTLIKNGTGTVIVKTTNGYTGQTMINAGTLQLGDGTTDGSIDSTAGITNDGTLVLNRSTGSTFTYNSLISGSGGLVKSGAGTQVLGGANTYGGGTTVSGGVLRITTTAGAANTGVLNLAGGTFQVDLGTGTNFNYNRTINLDSESTFGNVAAGSLANTTGQINYTGTINGGGNTLNIASTGVARTYLNGTLNNVDQINILSGVMGFDINATASRGTTSVDIANGAALWYAGNNANPITNDLTFHGGNGVGGGALYFEGGNALPAALTGSITLAEGTTGVGTAFANDTITLGGTVSGSGGLTILKGTTSLTQANKYSGGTLIHGAIAVANNSAALGTGDVSISTLTGGQLRLAAGVSVANNLTINGGGIIVQGALHAAGDATYAGAITITGSTAAGAHFATAAGTLSLDGKITSDATTVTVRTGTVLLNNDESTYPGLDIRGGTVKIGAENTIPTVITVSMGASEASRLDLNGFNQTLAGLTKAAQAATVTNGGLADSLLTLTGTSSFGGVIADGGTNKVALNITSGTTTLSGANTFTGPTNINGGTLVGAGASTQIGGALASTASITVNSGGTLRSTENGLFGWGGTVEKPIVVNAGGTLTAGAGVNVNVGTVTLAGGEMTNEGAAPVWGSWTFRHAGDTLAATADSTVSAQNVFMKSGATVDVATGVTLDFTGTLTDASSDGTGSLIKTGDGKLQLSGTNTYSGGTSLLAGEISVTGTGRLGTGNVQVAGGATLSLAFNDAINDVATLTIDDGGIAALSGGIESVSQLVLGSTAFLNGTYGGVGSGAENIYSEFFAPTSSGNFVSVPEPSSLGLLAMGGVGLLRRRRRSR